MELLLVFSTALIIGFVLGCLFTRYEANHHIKEIKGYSQKSIDTMEAKFNVLANQILNNQKEKLEQDNNDYLELLLKPLRDNIYRLDKAINDVNEKSVAHHTVFINAIEKLEKQTISIGREADNLAKALKNENKVQGDWGEMILSNILERSGLREGEEYEMQKNFKSIDGNNVRPDVIIKFPEGKHLIIDSKVSLKDFIDYINADNKIESERALKNHIESVRRHINELSKQNYQRDVKGSPEYVIMFMPSEASYVAAVQYDDTINNYAWSKKVIMVCPNTLIMTLEIVNNIWQSARQAKNVEKIINSANDLYYHFALFTETYSKIGRSLETLQNDYSTGLKRLSEGRGNIVQRFENMKELGLSPKKEIDNQLKE